MLNAERVQFWMGWWSGPAMTTEQKKNKEAGAMVIILKLWPIYRSHFGPVHKLGCWET